MNKDKMNMSTNITLLLNKEIIIPILDIILNKTIIQYNTITNLYSALGGVPSSYQLRFTWMFTILFTRLMA